MPGMYNTCMYFIVFRFDPLSSLSFSPCSLRNWYFSGSFVEQVVHGFHGCCQRNGVISISNTYICKHKYRLKTAVDKMQSWITPFSFGTYLSIHNSYPNEGMVSSVQTEIEERGVQALPSRAKHSTTYSTVPIQTII